MNKNTGTKKSLQKILTGAGCVAAVSLITLAASANKNAPQNQSNDDFMRAKIRLEYLQRQYEAERQNALKEAADFAEMNQFIKQRKQEMYLFSKKMKESMDSMSADQYIEAQETLERLSSELENFKDSLIVDYVSKNKALDSATKDMLEQTKYVDALRQDSIKYANSLKQSKQAYQDQIKKSKANFFNKQKQR